MTRSFETPQAFRTALHDRLRNEAQRRNVAIETLRMKLLIERLLARLFADASAPWLLKGGYAFELRYRPRARSTRDVDLTVARAGRDADALIPAIHRELGIAVKRDLGDFFDYLVAPPRPMLVLEPQIGARFPIVATLAGKEAGRFHLDVGCGDPLVGTPDDLVGEDWLAFAGIEPARVRAISKAQHFAEKIHAYTLPRGYRENTRVKDLVDLVLLIERGDLERADVRRAIEATFAARERQPIPVDLEPPPSNWAPVYRSLSVDVGVNAFDVTSAFERLREFWGELMSRRPT